MGNLSSTKRYSPGFRHEPDMKTVELRMDKIMETVNTNLENRGFQEKQVTLGDLNIKVTILEKRVEIRGLLPENYVLLHEHRDFCLDL